MTRSLLEQCIYEEETLQFDRFSQSDALILGMKLVEQSLLQPKPAAVEIVLNGLTVFRYFPDGTTRYNEQWLQWKRNTVNMKQMSSLRVFAELEQSKETMEDWFLDPKEFAACGGGFPIRIKNSGVVGFIGVSGLPHLQDHEVVINALQDYLKME